MSKWSLQRDFIEFSQFATRGFRLRGCFLGWRFFLLKVILSYKLKNSIYPSILASHSIMKFEKRISHHLLALTVKIVHITWLLFWFCEWEGYELFMVSPHRHSIGLIPGEAWRKKNILLANCGIRNCCNVGKAFWKCDDICYCRWIDP